VVTLDIGPFQAIEKILTDANETRTYHSQHLRELTPWRCTYGYDVLIHVGYALFVNHRSEQQIIGDLARRNISLSQGEIGFFGSKIYCLSRHCPPAEPASIKSPYGRKRRLYSAPRRHLRKRQPASFYRHGRDLQNCIGKRQATLGKRGADYPVSSKY